MASHQLMNILSAAALVIGVASCGGGTQVAGGGIGGTGISQGPITGFGSIFVNGVKFDTANAAIVKDGATVTQSDLQIGMVVTVDGNIASSTQGSAATVTYAKELEGPLTAKDAHTLTVLGQTVIVDDLTKIVIAGITAPTLADLTVGETVEVSGLRTGSGIRATYIERKTDTADVELKGVITAKSGTTLTIGTLSVDLSGVTPSFTPAVGDYVEIKGTLVGANLAATSLELRSRTLDNSKDKAEIEGYVTAVGTAGDFTLDAQPVQTDAQTRFVGGAGTDIKIGLKLEVEGPLVSGTLTAAKVSFKDDLALEGSVKTLDAVNGVFTLDSYPGIDISYNAVLTEGEDGADLTALAVGSRVKVRGRKLDGCATNTACMLATQVRLESGSTGTGSSALLQGTVESVADPLITVLGVTVDTSVIADRDFGGDGVSGRTDFFNQVAVGRLVEIKGTRDAAGNVTWQSIDLED